MTIERGRNGYNPNKVKAVFRPTDLSPHRNHADIKGWELVSNEADDDRKDGSPTTKHEMYVDTLVRLGFFNFNEPTVFKFLHRISDSSRRHVQNLSNFPLA